ncbi:TRAP transporter substrate-binding protein [Thalassospira sp. TSL5-1]|uniref:TRAP transporter substrate-binding protein n=1 Tax=Thalassospira sp. TSL5-1 TaxID=1544451 RepID=UPI00093B63F7|nr:TRAP transporter substrate-binding protein [Thalassospira sp. TSL5-1]OKH90007.1 ABC transporter substrate-binding protein [Thalassospira sp. TSL5-1]
MKRRQFLSGAALAGATAAVASAFPKPALAQDVREWRMVTTWPKNFPGLGTGANLLAEYINKASDGRMKVTVYGAGEIVPAFEAIDAVGNGTVEMGHGAPYYWKGKVAAAQYLAAMPFGLTAQEQNAWFQYGGGQEIADKIYEKLNCKFFPSGNTGTQMGGWFNKEMNTIDDFKGLKMRIPGLGGEVIQAAGGNVVNLPGGEIPPALQSGAIDATEWVGPYNDLAFGLYKTAKYYYYPGWHEPATTLENFINLSAWNDLPDDLKAIVEQANRATNQMVLSEFVARNNQALKTLQEKHNVDVRPFSDDILTNLGALSGKVLRDLVASDPLSQEVFDSLIAFREQAASWAKYSELAFMQARTLPFKY